MRQTSRAVALLLAVESAQATVATLTAQIPNITSGNFYFTTVFYPDSSDALAPTTSMQLNSRTAGYTWNQRVFGKTAATTPSMMIGTTPYQLAVAVNTYSDSKAAGGSSCVQCIGAGAVWCSRTFAYLETAVTTTQAPYNYELTTVSASLMSIQLVGNLATDELTGQTGASKDQGSCCWDSLNFQNFIGNQAASVVPDEIPNLAASPVTDGVVFVDASCVALKPKTANTTITSNIWGVMQIDDATTQYSSWWCSNGLYKKVWLDTATPTAELNSQQIIGNGVNKRMELALVGCPQKTLMCGTGASTALTIVSALTSTAKTFVVDPALLGLTDKCTWVAQAFIAAPTFKFGLATDIAGTAGTGITSSNWQIHAMEFAATAVSTDYSAADGALETAVAGSNVGYQSKTSAVTNGTYIPKFNMPADQFATLRTWYGEAPTTINDVSNLPAAWLTPGQAPVDNSVTASMLLATVKTEQYGNVVNVPYSTISTQTGSTTPVGDTNYGTYNSASFDLRQARYFPAQVAQTVHAAGTTQYGLYTTAKSDYATAKTAWDNYVAILEKNAKTDAFAALFSPPKAPTVPPLPALPWVPAAYGGYVRATAAELNLYRLSSTTATYATTTNPTAQQFWNNLSSAQTVGGWGTFTAQVLRYRNGWGKSFGTIGYSGAATNDMSAVWNYKWTCATAGATAPGTTPCDATYAGSIATVTNAAAVVNLTSMVSVVSLWSTANKQGASPGTDVTAYAFTGQSFSLTWTPSAWSGTLVALKAIAAPVAATAAKGLSGVAGAQALAATSAAALAVAAALY